MVAILLQVVALVGVIVGCAMLAGVAGVVLGCSIAVGYVGLALEYGQAGDG